MKSCPFREMWTFPSSVPAKRKQPGRPLWHLAVAGQVRHSWLSVKLLIPVAVICLLMHSSAPAQTAGAGGRVVEHERARPLGGAYIWLIGNDPSETRHTAQSDSAGYFRFSGLGRHRYTLQVAYLGYETKTLQVTIDRDYVDLGTIVLDDSLIEYPERLVEARMIGTEQKGDTTEYSANAFVTEPDAIAEDLITKMPGVIVDEEGSVRAQGEDIQQILVDGVPYFSSDPTLTLKNLPADIIARVQVFDKASDQSQLTGFDDGQSIKTMNIITKTDRNRAAFGRGSWAYGSDSRYSGNGSFNFFDGNRRLTLIGLSNNVSQQNFSQQDLLGVMGETGRTMRSGGSGGMFGQSGRGGSRQNSGGALGFGEGSSSFLVGQLPGLTTAHSAGFNHSDSLASGLFESASYFFNLTDNRNPQTISRQYGFFPDSSAYYAEHDAMTQKNFNHRFNLRVDYVPDSSNEILFTPHFYIQDNHGSNKFDAETLLPDGTPTGLGTGYHQTLAQGYSGRGTLSYRHKFSTAGRTISADASAGKNHRTSNKDVNAFVSYPPGSLGRPDSLNHESDVTSEGYSYATNLMYTEPLGENGLLQLTYTPSYTHGSSDDQAYDFDPLTGTYSLYNPRFSNIHETKYWTQKAGAGFRYRMASVNGSIGLSYQVANLGTDQTFPRTTSVDKTFYTLLPNFLLNIDFNNQSDLRIYYRTSTSTPSVTQLQDLVNKSNLLLVTAGNPDLRQSYTHAISVRLSLASIERGQNFFLYGGYAHTSDYIGTLTYIATHDTVLRRGIRLVRGAQLTEPVNVDEFWRVRLHATYGFPLDFLKSSLNIRLALNTISTPGIIRFTPNSSVLTSLSPGILLASTASETFDFTVSYSFTLHRLRNSSFPDLDNDFYSHTVGARVHLSFLKRCVLRTDFSNMYSTGPADSLNRNLLVWNFHLGYKLFSNRRGEIYINCHNLFNEDASITRTQTESYVEDAENLVIDRYAILGFSYTLR